MIGPKRWAFLGGTAFVFVVVGEALHQGELLVLALPLVCYLAVGSYFSLPHVELHARRILNERRVMSGESASVRVEIHNIGARLEIVEIADSVPDSVEIRAGRSCKVESLWPGQSTALEYTVSGLRGLARWQSLHITATDTLGLFVKSAEIPCEGELLIVPTFERLEDILIHPRRTRIFSGQVKAGVGGTGIEFFGVREYYPGDERRYLNWKATARRGRLIVNEFEQERVADIIILLDARERSDVLGLFEHSVRAALALAQYCISQGNRVGLLIYGKYLNWTWPGIGRWQRERLVRALAAAEKGDKAVFEDLEYLPTRLLPAGSQLIFVGPILESDVQTMLDLRLRYEILCVAPNPIVVEGRTLPQAPETDLALRLERLRRSSLLAQLRRGGIRVLDWDVTQPLASIIAREAGRAAWRAAVVRRGIAQ